MDSRVHGDGDDSQKNVKLQLKNTKAWNDHETRGPRYMFILFTQTRVFKCI